MAAQMSAAWDVAWAKYEGLKAADKVLDDAYNAAMPNVPADLEASWDASATALNDAGWVLFEAPAPTLRALRWKLEFVGDKGICLDADMVETLTSDLDQMIGGAA